MKDTKDDFDDISEKEDQSTLALIIIAALCVAGIVIAQIMKPQTKATISIEMPPPPSIQNNTISLGDTIYNLYLLGNDSAALYFGRKLTLTTLTDIFSDTTLIENMKARVVLIKPHTNADYQSITTVLDQANKYNLQRFAMVKYPEGEFERLRDQSEAN